MLNPMFFASLMMATPQGQGAAQAQPNPILAMAPFILMFVIFYFLIIRPQKTRQAEVQKMIEALKKGDRVVTTGGILGTVVGVKEKTVVIRVGDGDTKLEILRSAISNLADEKDSKAT